MSEPTYRPLERRGRWVIGLTWGMVALEVMYVPVPLSYLDPGLFMVEGGWAVVYEILYRYGQAVELGFLVMATIQPLAYFAWLYRAARNVRALGAVGLPTSPGWAVGWHFVPIWSLWKPYLALIDIARASSSAAGWREATAGRRYRGLWAVSVVLTLAALGLAGLLLWENLDPARFHAYDRLQYGIELGTFPAYVALHLLTIAVVRDITGLQAGQHARTVFD